MNRQLSQLSLLLLVGLTFLLAGCDRDEVRTHTAPRPDHRPDTGPVRVLAALVPVGEEVWFFKLAGRADILDAVEPVFNGLIDSLQPAPEGAEDALTWKVPAGWKEDRTNQNRVATLRPEGPGSPELAISRLPAAGGALKPNIDRWRRVDLGLGPIHWQVVPKVARKREVAGLDVTLVDLRGPGVAKGHPAKMPAGHPPARREKAPLQYKTPADWKEVSPSSSIVAAAFQVGDARVLVTPLGGTLPGGLLGNINRWRGEIGLPDLKEAGLEKTDIRKVKVAGVEARYVDLVGNEKRSLVVWFEHDQKTWFFKLLGPSQTVGKQKDNFEKFLQSVTFPGA